MRNLLAVILIVTSLGPYSAMGQPLQVDERTSPVTFGPVPVDVVAILVGFDAASGIITYRPLKTGELQTAEASPKAATKAKKLKAGAKVTIKYRDTTSSDKLVVEDINKKRSVGSQIVRGSLIALAIPAAVLAILAILFVTVGDPA